MVIGESGRGGEKGGKWRRRGEGRRERTDGFSVVWGGGVKSAVILRDTKVRTSKETWLCSQDDTSGI